MRVQGVQEVLSVLWCVVQNLLRKATMSCMWLMVYRCTITLSAVVKEPIQRLWVRKVLRTSTLKILKAWICLLVHRLLHYMAVMLQMVLSSSTPSAVVKIRRVSQWAIVVLSLVLRSYQRYRTAMVQVLDWWVGVPSKWVTLILRNSSIQVPISLIRYRCQRVIARTRPIYPCQPQMRKVSFQRTLIRVITSQPAIPHRSWMTNWYWTSVQTIFYRRMQIWCRRVNITIPCLHYISSLVAMTLMKFATMSAGIQYWATWRSTGLTGKAFIHCKIPTGFRTEWSAQQTSIAICWTRH